ncbi:MAG TPA: hypothetical protein VMQ83_10575, partial [Gammaproteobacteria bacterium]|nr:hypothetical protein [Gammaproteobacteria bacterium]
KQWVIGTVVGGVVIFAVGYVIFDVLLGDYYAANSGSATGVMRDPPIVWALAVGALAYAALILYALRAQAASVNVISGMKVGAIVGFLLWACADFSFYGITNMSNLTLTIVDPFVELVHGGIAGAVLGALLPKVA